MPGLTLVVLLVNECALAALASFRARRRHAWRALALGTALVATLAAHGAWRGLSLKGAEASAPRVHALLVQANFARYGELARELGEFETVALVLETHFALSAEALARTPADLVVWPETVYPTTFGSPKSADGAAFDRAIAAFAAQSGVPLVFGSHDADAGGEYNAAIFLEASGAGRVSFDAYRKAAPFPLTERVPDWLDSPWLREALPWLGAWRAGEGARVIDLSLSDGRTLRAGPLICYDALDPSLARTLARDGADLFVTLSNDSWFSHAGGPRLHLLVAAFRSIETGRAQLRATNTGFSALISPRGAIEQRLAVNERGVLAVEAPLLGGYATPYSRIGDALPRAAGVLAIAACAWAARRKR